MNLLLQALVLILAGAVLGFGWQLGATLAGAATGQRRVVVAGMILTFVVVIVLIVGRGLPWV